jgi:redox-sensitive bicupin YhaK (pirin superfamily)
VSTRDVQIEEVVQFRDFRVERLTLEPACEFSVENDSGYCLLMGIAGHVTVNGVALLPEQALFVSAGTEQIQLSGPAEQKAILLLAKPAT